MKLCAKLLFVAVTLSGPFHPHPALGRECVGVMIHPSGPASIKVGEVAVFRFAVSNHGECSIEDAVIEDYLPRKTIYVDASPQPTLVPPIRPGVLSTVDKVRWDKLSLPPESPEQLYEVRIRVEAPGNRVITNTACLEHPKTGRICEVFDTYVRPFSTRP